MASGSDRACSTQTQNCLVGRVSIAPPCVRWRVVFRRGYAALAGAQGQEATSVVPIDKGTIEQSAQTLSGQHSCPNRHTVLHSDWRSLAQTAFRV